MVAPSFVSFVSPIALPGTLNFPASGLLAGDLCFIVLEYKGSASNVGTISGRTKDRADAGGSVFTDVYKHVSVGAADHSTSVGTISITGATGVAYMMIFRSTTGVVGVRSSGVGEDNTSAASFSAVTGNMDTAVDDRIVYFLNLVTGGPITRTGRAITQAGGAYGAINARFGAGASVTAESGDRTVTTGVLATPFTHSYTTLGAASTGLTTVYSMFEATAGLTFGLAQETDSAFSLDRSKARDLGLTSETESAFSLDRLKSATLGFATEADSAFAFTASKSFSLGLIAETDSVFSLARSKTVDLGLTSETDSAQVLARSKAMSFNLATSSDTAFPLAFSKSLALGVAQSAEQPLPLSRMGSLSLGLAAESDSAHGLLAAKVLVLGLVAYDESALPLVLSNNASFVFGLIQESESVFAVTQEKSLLLGLPTEEDSSFTLSRATLLQLGVIVSAETAHAISLGKAYTFGLSTESDTALLLVLPDVEDDELVVYRNGVAVVARIGGVVRNGVLIESTDWEVT